MVEINRVVTEQEDGTWVWTVWRNDGVTLTAIGEGVSDNEADAYANANAVEGD